MNTDFHKVTIDDQGVATITLTRPEKHNAFDDYLIKELNASLAELKNLSSIRMLILRAEGKSFSAGADLNWMKRMQSYSKQQNIDDAEQLRLLMENLNTFPYPTIAVVEGAAFGGGVGLVACCDIALATTKAKFSFSEVKIGLIPAVISPYIIDCVGLKACRRYFLTGERFDAQRAKQIGLVDEIVNPDEIENILLDFIQHILEGSPASQKGSKQLLFKLQDPKTNIKQETVECIANIRVSEEGQEGLRSFLEKRQPKWNQTKQENV